MYRFFSFCRNTELYDTKIRRSVIVGGWILFTYVLQQAKHTSRNYYYIKIMLQAKALAFGSLPMLAQSTFGRSVIGFVLKSELRYIYMSYMSAICNYNIKDEEQLRFIMH